jgi:hypothetical protein
MSATYSKTSPYYNTPITNGYLDVLSFRNIPATTDDLSFVLDSKYQNRPDLLAYDIYGDPNLWWVFAARNPSVIKDPVYDMIPGTVIFLPQASTIKSSLGT